jgi:predicted acyltransferase
MEKQRLLSLDVFRGFTILLMTIVNNPGSWATVYPPLLHAEWNGCTFADLVFPFFILILGVAIPFALPTKNLNLESFTKILVRSLRIFCLGFFLFFFNKISFGTLEGFPLIAIRLSITVLVTIALLGNFSLKTKRNLVFAVFLIMMTLALTTSMFAEVRIPGVLQRIGIVYFFAAILYLKTNFKQQIVIATVLLLGYYLLMAFVPVPGFGEANFNVGTNLSAWLDSVLLKNHMYVQTKTWDPEGTLSTLPAIAQAIIGGLIGQVIINKKQKMLQKLTAIGVVLMVLGLLFNLIFPINKALWSSSYVLFTSGLATLILSALYFIIDVKSIQKWAKPFLIWGVNPMIVFFFSGIIPRILSLIKFPDTSNLPEKINLQTYLYKNFIAVNFSNPMNASLAGSIIYILIWTFILWIFYKKNLIFKV